MHDYAETLNINIMLAGDADFYFGLQTIRQWIHTHHIR